MAVMKVAERKKFVVMQSKVLSLILPEWIRTQLGPGTLTKKRNIKNTQIMVIKLLAHWIVLEGGKV